VRLPAFLRAGILGEDGRNTGPITGTPQGGILSPVLANIALSVRTQTRHHQDRTHHQRARHNARLGTAA